MKTSVPFAMAWKEEKIKHISTDHTKDYTSKTMKRMIKEKTKTRS